MSRGMLPHGAGPVEPGEDYPVAEEAGRVRTTRPGSIRVHALLGSPTETFPAERMVTFTLAGGEEVAVMLTSDGSALEVRNLGRTERFALAVMPRSSNEVRIEAGR